MKMHKAEMELMLDLRNGEVRRNDVEAAKEYAHLKRDGESFLRQKSRIHWLKEGRGTTTLKFFSQGNEAISKSKARISMVTGEDGEPLCDNKGIKGKMIRYFQTL